MHGVLADVDFVALFSSNRSISSTKSSLVYQKLFCFVALWVFEKRFHFRSDASDYITMLNPSLMKTSTQLWQDDLPNKILISRNSSRSNRRLNI